MGTDIYTQVEKRIRDKWTRIRCDFPEPRDYDLFAILAGVGPRGDNFIPIVLPRGLPDNVSDEVKEYVQSLGDEARCVSYLTLAELESFDWRRSRSLSEGLPYEDYAKPFLSEALPLLANLASGESGSVRVIFWFDNCASCAWKMNEDGSIRTDSLT